ncbi:MAG: hypothetical protein MK008_05840 [Bdellovibrionales bacterium]|nr:hypothetical protein [Bdellovibrionales bacterium]
MLLHRFNHQIIHIFTFIIFSVCLFQSPAWAKYTSEEKLAFHVKNELEHINTNNLQHDYEAIIKLKKHKAPYKEVISELLRRIRYEVQGEPQEFGQGRFLVVDEILSTLKSLLNVKSDSPINVRFDYKGKANYDLVRESYYTLYDYEIFHGLEFKYSIDQVMDLLRIKTAIESLPNDLQSFKPILDNIKDQHKPYTRFESSIPEIPVKEAEEQREFVLPSLLRLSIYRDFDKDSNNEEIKRVESFLNEKVIEQPELIKFFIQTLKKDYLHQRTSPNVFVTMGLPGTGKDTGAESFIRAIHRNDPNWESHLYRFNIIRSPADLWGELGSTSGHVDSDKLPPFIKWAVEHSGGKYILETIKKPLVGNVTKVVLNPEWKGENLPGKIPPEKALVYINEFHDWAYDEKNSFLKQFFEKGIIPINNPNEGLDHIRLNFNVQVASNDGIDAIADRHLDGRSRGRKLGYDELIKKWEAIAFNVTKLRELLVRPATEGSSQYRKGTSEEVGNRFYNIFMLRPTSPEGLRKIANISLNDLKAKFAKINKQYGKIELSWSYELQKFIQEYQYVAEENARPIHHKVEALVEKTINNAILDETIKADGKPKSVYLDITNKEDGTSALKVQIQTSDYVENKELLIEQTKEVKYNNPLSNEEIERLKDLPNRLKSQVFGVDSVIDKVSKAIFKSEIDKNVNLDRADAKLPKANVFGFFGLSSTGKTELTKVIAKELTGDASRIWTLSGNDITHELEWKANFGYNQDDPKDKSKFQKEFDRFNGKLLVVIDEITNANMKGIEILYDYFREGEVGGRKMANVTFLLTGNVGQEWYEGIPKEIPELERHFSMLEIYNRASKNLGAQENLLLKYFPDALIKRIGMERIFFFPPLNFKSIREMFFLKIKQAFNSTFRPNKETHWFKAAFESSGQAYKVIELFEREGFTLKDQGASIDRFVNTNFVSELRQLLIYNNIEIGSEVILSLNEEKTKEHNKKAENYLFEGKQDNKGIYLNVKIPSANKNLILFVEGKPFDFQIKSSKKARARTAYHEAGHSVTQQVFLGDSEKPLGVKIKPGVTDINGQWIYYSGLASSLPVKGTRQTKDYLLRQMATLHGGWVAETLVTKEETHDHGKQNDIQRASDIARMGILALGLSEAFGKQSIPNNMSLLQFANSLSPEDHKIFTDEFKKWMKESEKMALDALLLNYDSFIRLGYNLAKKGEFLDKQLQGFYEKQKKSMVLEWVDNKEFERKAEMVRNHQYTRDEIGRPRFFSEMGVLEKVKFKYLSKPLVAHDAKKIRDRESKAYRNKEAEFISPKLIPKDVADVNALFRQEIAESTKGVMLPEGFPVKKPSASPQVMSCKSLF